MEAGTEIHSLPRRGSIPHGKPDASTSGILSALATTLGKYHRQNTTLKGLHRLGSQWQPAMSHANLFSIHAFSSIETGQTILISGIRLDMLHAKYSTEIGFTANCAGKSTILYTSDHSALDCASNPLLASTLNSKLLHRLAATVVSSPAESPAQDT